MIEEALQIIAQNTVELVLIVLLPAVLRVVIAWGTSLFNDAKSHLNETQQYLIVEFAETAVRATEQLGIKDAMLTTGTSKYNKAAALLSAQLERIGVELSEAELRAYIEDAVYRVLGDNDATFIELNTLE